MGRPPRSQLGPMWTLLIHDSWFVEEKNVTRRSCFVSRIRKAFSSFFYERRATNDEQRFPPIALRRCFYIRYGEHHRFARVSIY